MPTKEEWRDVIGHEGVYQVSNLGRLRRSAISANNAFKAGRLLNPGLPRKGYCRVWLYRDGKRIERLFVHQIVARAFLGPRPKGYEINHKNGDKSDNRVSNLEYVTPRENILHARDTLGVRFGPVGERAPFAKLTENKVRIIRQLYTTGLYSQREIGEFFGVSTSQIGRIVRKERWGHVE